MSDKNDSMAKRIGTLATAAALSIATIGAGSITALAADTPDDPGQGEEQPTPAEETMTASVGGHDVTFTPDGDGNYTAGINDYKGLPPETVVASTESQPTITLTASYQTENETNTVGVINQTGVATYTGEYTTGEDPDTQTKTVTLTIDYTRTVGKEITVKDGSGFTDGWATAPDVTLNNDDTAAVNTVTLSNGQTLPIHWQTGTHSQVTGGATQVILDGVATGTITVNQPHASHDWTVNVNVRAVRTDTWSATVNGVQHPFITAADGSQSLTTETQSVYPQPINVTGSNGTTFSIDPQVNGLTAVGADKLGLMTVNGDGYYHADPTGKLPRFDVTAPFSYTTGGEVTITTSDGTPNIPFIQGEDGVFAATAPTLTLDTRNQPSADTISLSDGSTAHITWADTPTVVERDGANFIVLTGEATGTLTSTDPASGASVTQPYRISVNASRAEDKSFTTLSVQQTTPDGDSTTLPVNGFNADQHEYSMTLPQSSVSNAFTLTMTTGVDATTSTPKVGFGANGGRILTVTVNGSEYRVNVNFTPADIKPDSPAKLDGIYVNYEGKPTQGRLIDNWNPNRLDYTVSIGLEDPSPYILPVASHGVSVSAGDVTQNAQSSTQTWKVTDTATGVTREYSVTVVRPVETAVTTFKPGDPIAQEQTVQPDSPEDAELASHGYVDKTGEYVEIDENRYLIPEGGTFSYEAKAGQTVSVASSHVGMTYTYTVTVLPQNTSGFPKTHTYTVTYLTEATHRAELTGIAVDGTLIPNFDKDTHEYTVAVNDPDEWTVTPQFDKTTGMSISTQKEGAKAVITVTSGDGLNDTEYTVNVTRKLFGGEGTVGVGGLAQTGLPVTGIPTMLATLAAAAIASILARRRLHATRWTTNN